MQIVYIYINIINMITNTILLVALCIAVLIGGLAYGELWLRYYKLKEEHKIDVDTLWHQIRGMTKYMEKKFEQYDRREDKGKQFGSPAAGERE